MATDGKMTLSVIKADVGGWVGHSTCHPGLSQGPLFQRAHHRRLRGRGAGAVSRLQGLATSACRVRTAHQNEGIDYWGARRIC